MALVLFFIYLIPVAIIFAILLKVGLVVIIKAIQLAWWLGKLLFSIAWKLLVFITVVIIGLIKTNVPPKVLKDKRRKYVPSDEEGCMLHEKVAKLFPLVKYYF